MKGRSLPEIPVSALRNHADGARIDRVWQRIEADVASAPRAVRLSAWWWAPAAAIVLFGSGVFVGARWARPQIMATMRAEAPSPLSAPASRAAAPNVLPELRNEPAKPSRSTPATRTPAAAPASEVSAPSEPVFVAPTPAAPVPLAPPEWHRLANAGDFAAARRVVDQQGGFDAALATASPEELMSLADVARASGSRDYAVRALRQVLSHPQAPEAPLAAYTLGNLLDQLGDKKGAAEAFALYQRLSPKGDFAEDAAARQVDVALSQGNPELVAQLVDEYARNFPNGRRLAEFRRALAKLTAPKDDRPGKSNSANDNDEDEATEGTLGDTPAPQQSAKPSKP